MSRVTSEQSKASAYHLENLEAPAKLGAVELVRQAGLCHGELHPEAEVELIAERESQARPDGEHRSSCTGYRTAWQRDRAAAESVALRFKRADQREIGERAEQRMVQAVVELEYTTRTAHRTAQWNPVSKLTLQPSVRVKLDRR